VEHAAPFEFFNKVHSEYIVLFLYILLYECANVGQS
jgi:hypothetical protein